MKLRIFSTAVLFAGIGAISTATAANISVFMDDFESYADTAAMEAVWGVPGNGALATTTGNPGQSMQHLASATAGSGVSYQRSIPGTNPTDARPLIWKFDFLDDGVGNKRMTGALRDVGGSAAGNQAFFEMGRFNSINDPESGTTVAGYGIRHVFVGGTPAGAGGWLTYVGNPAVQQGWHRFTATIGDTFATFDLDFAANGSIDATRTIALGAAAAGKIYNIARLGTPSDVTSAGGGAHFDNVMVCVVPEPGTLALVTLAIMAGLAWGRRRSA
jgi:hypothetical protein